MDKERIRCIKVDEERVEWMADEERVEWMKEE